MKHVLNSLHLSKKILVRGKKRLSELSACTRIGHTDDFKLTAIVAVTALGDDTDHGFIGGVSLHHITEGFTTREKT
ncbi:hypothetical protein D3C76_1509130 [compost metagenome]